MSDQSPANEPGLATASDPGQVPPGGQPSGLPEWWLTPPENAIWGDFQLAEMIGQGGMGAVFRGHQLSLNRPVAIKVLTPYLSNSESFRLRFLREAQTVAQISSPHVVQVYGAGSNGPHQYFAMEFVDGEDLGSKLAKGYRPSRAETLDIMIQAARGLVAAGEHDIVHRDIKPGNMMITRRGQVKLMDFGLLRIASDEQRNTTTGVVMGTVYYFSPEQARGEACDQRADIYSLGVVFFELLVGELPFTGEPNAVVYAHLNKRPPRVRDLDPEIPASWQEVVLTCLAKRPEGRYRTTAELLRDLERLAADEAPVLTSPVNQNPWPLRALGVALMVAIATITGHVIRPARSPGPDQRTGAVDASGAPALVSAMNRAPDAAIKSPSSPGSAADVAAGNAESEGDAVSLPKEIATLSGTCESTVVVRSPFIGGHIVSYRWSLEGDAGHAGRLGASATVLPETSWTAPGRATSALAIRVVARDAAGRDFTAMVPIRATPDDGSKPRSLTQFARLGTGEPTAARLAQDATGDWWACDPSAKRICHVHPDWLDWRNLKSQGDSRPEHPLDLAIRDADVAILDGLLGKLLLLKRDGLEGGTATMLGGGVHWTRPVDLAFAGDGRILVADEGAGAIHVLNSGTQDGATVVLDGFHPSRIATSPDGDVFVLDGVARRMQRLDRDLRSAASWAVTGDGESAPVDIAWHGLGLLVLMSDGSIQVFDRSGSPHQRLGAPTELIDGSGKADSLAVGAAGEILSTWPSRRLIARHASSGIAPGVRGIGAHPGAGLAADGRGRLLILDAASARISLLDSEGWCGERVGGRDKDGGAFTHPEQLAVSPDGRALAVIEPEQAVVVRVALDGSGQSLTLGSTGTKKTGKLAHPAAVALDELGRTYVLDADDDRISVYDAKGTFRFAFAGRGAGAGRFKGPLRFAVSPRGLLAFIVDNGANDLIKLELDHEHGVANIADTAHLDAATAISAIASDRQALLYVLEGNRTLRILDWKSDKPLAVTTVAIDTTSILKAESMAVSPDGQVWLGNGEDVIGLRW